MVAAEGGGMTRTCLDCPKPIGTRSKGRCKRCSMIAVNRTPEMRSQSREILARQMQSDTFGRSGGRKGWCPPEYRQLNRKLTAQGYDLDERQKLIFADAAVQAKRAEARV
jgi:hypothetical protein